MSKITRCTGCGTAFRITQEQLAARDGQVRCGRCGTAFDGRAALVPEARSEVEAPASRSIAARTLPPAAGRPNWSITDPSDIDFGPKPRPRRSRLWGAATAIALIALAAQFIFHFRGEIALVWPAAHPVLARACAEVGCELPLPRRPELMSIEASDLQSEPGSPGVMVLSATLRNRAAFPQQFPALELTLTNLQDRPVARRVLTAQDYLARGIDPEPGFAPDTELPIKVFLEAAALKPTGYRLYLFYP